MQMIPNPEVHSAQPPRLLDEVRRCIRARHYSIRTEEQYVYWVRSYVRFHLLRHPREMGAAEVGALPWLGEIGRPRATRRLPVVLTRDEVSLLLHHIAIEHRLVAQLLYGTGMRILEALRLSLDTLAPT